MSGDASGAHTSGADTSGADTSGADAQRASVDLDAMGTVASSLLLASADLRDVVAGLLRHAPDPGLPPAPDAVVDVQGGALDTVGALATSLDESSQLLALTARRYRGTEDEVVRALKRLGEEGGR
jgi:hypothetical protein